MADYQLSVIMPALNEEAGLDASIGNVLGAFKRHGVAGEIVVVDDGSRDRTGQLADRWAARDSRIRVVHHDLPQGIGSAFWDGVRHASGEVVTMIPGDGENDAGEILRYLPLLQHVDVVVPFFFNPRVRSAPRRWLSSLFHRIVRLTTGIPLTYLNGTVLYRRAIFEGLDLRSRGFFYQAELLLKSVGCHYLYAEVPCALRVRRGGRSKALSLRSLATVVVGYLAALRDLRALRRHPPPIAPGTATAARRRELGAPAGGAL